jgi:hypothetical protein
MKRFLRVGVVVLACALVAGACGGKEDKNKIDQNVGPVSTSSTAAGVNTSTTLSLAAGSTTTAKAGPTTTAKPASPPPTTKPNVSTGFDINAIPTAGKQGTYTYSQQGTTPDGPAPANGSLIVTGAGPTQTLARKYDSAQAAAFELTIEYRSDGPVLTKALIRRQGIVITCSFATPVHYPPYPPNAGQSYSGDATCSNGLKASLAGSIVGHNKVTVQGKAYDVIVTTSALSITGSGVNVTANLNEWIAPQLGVPAYSRETFNGTAPLVGAISGDVTSTLTNIP